jgi:CubicO group peptidase (beta-lactamase class C family)
MNAAAIAAGIRRKPTPEEVCIKAFGRVDNRVQTATAIMQLMENNQLNLDDNINDHLPFSIQIPGFPNVPITFRQLMTHTSSIQDNYTFMDTYYNSPDPLLSLAECMSRYFPTNGEDYSTANFLNNSPGTVYEYSNIATALNGYLVQLISGMPFNEYCSSEIFDKLCMNKTAWFMADYDSSHVARPYQYSAGNYIPYAHYGFADYPSGQLRSNVVDMANFMIAMMNSGNFGGNSILTSASVNAMLTVQFSIRLS